MDYYQVLELDSNNCSHEDIGNNFRRLALKWHPMRDRNNVNSKMIQFNRLCESYEVLSDPNLKGIYDKQGPEGLKNQGKVNGSMTGGYTYTGRCFEIFEEFFGCDSPFADNFDNQKESRRENDANDPKAPKDIVIVLKCSIYEFYNGSLKEFTYNRKTLMPDGRTLQDTEQTLTVEVKPGYDHSTVLTYPTKGNQAYAYFDSCLQVKFELHNTEEAS